MTRDEAIAIITGRGWTSRGAERYVGALEALGILKLDKPLSPREKFIKAMLDQGYLRDSCGMTDALKAWDEVEA